MYYGFIGCGNMGGAVASALSQSTKDILICDRSGNAKALAAKLGIAYSDNETIVRQCDRIFLGVKPHQMEACLSALQPILAQRKPLLISMAAGLTLDRIRIFAGTDLPVIRIMPNTPTAVGKGVIPYCCNELVESGVLESWLADMAPCGLLDPLDETLMDAASALSGSGPAYLYILMEAMADGAVACGLPRDKALAYAAATMSGAAQMYLQTRQHPGALKDAVCSPGGSTIEGLAVLEERGFRSAAIDCIAAAYQKNQKMGT